MKLGKYMSKDIINICADTSNFKEMVLACDAFVDKSLFIEGIVDNRVLPMAFHLHGAQQKPDVALRDLRPRVHLVDGL